MVGRRYNDSTLGALCGLGVAAATWTLATSPALIDLSFWLFLGAGMLACLWQPRLPGIGSVTWRLPFVVSALLLFGIGAALAAHVVGSLTVVLSRREERSSGFVLGTLYDLASGALVTLLASLAYVAAGGVHGDGISGTFLVPLCAFAMMYVVSEHVADALRVQATHLPPTPETGRRWLHRSTSTAVSYTHLTLPTITE